MANASFPERAPRWWSTRRVVVRDRSMEPTLLAGDRLLVDRAAFRRHAPRPGDLVVLPDPFEPGRWLIKRVAVVGPARPADGGPTVPPGSVWVVSDAPERARDSRTFGPVRVADLVGRAFRRYGPADRRGELSARPERLSDVP